MFGVARSRVIRALIAMSDNVCGYVMPGAPMRTSPDQPHVRCDCKYGYKGKNWAEINGCPELEQAAQVLAALTPLEFKRACRRAHIRVSRHDEDAPVKGSK